MQTNAFVSQEHKHGSDLTTIQSSKNINYISPVCLIRVQTEKSWILTIFPKPVWNLVNDVKAAVALITKRSKVLNHPGNNFHQKWNHTLFYLSNFHIFTFSILPLFVIFSSQKCMQKYIHWWTVNLFRFSKIQITEEGSSTTQELFPYWRRISSTYK